MSLNSLVKSVLPKPVVNAISDKRLSVQLSSAPQEQFDAANLKPDADLTLDSILRDEKITTAWQRDHALLNEAIHDGDGAGGVNAGDRRTIYYLISALKPGKVLEVGTHIGASMLQTAAALKSAGGGTMTTVDITDVNAPDAAWSRTKGCAMSPADYASRLGLRDRITFVTSPALDFMAKTKDRYDFIFLDGDHGPIAVYREVAIALKLLNPGGVILLHDFFPGGRPLFPDGVIISGPSLALKRISRENPQIMAKPLGALPWPTKQGSNVTTLALVLKKGE